MAGRAPPTGSLGTAITGVQMARRLAQAGHEVRARNRSREKAERLAVFGTDVVATPADAVRDAEVVIRMLSSGPVCDEALLGPGEAIAVVREDATLVVTSSIPVETAAARRVAYLDAPVSGGEEAGTGELAKLVNRLIVAGTIAVVAEAVLLAERGGADPARVREVLLGGFARSTILEQHAPRMMARGFRPGGPAKHQVEDTSTVLAFARGPGLPVATLVDRPFADLVGHGDGDLDRSAVIRKLRRHNDLPLT